MIRVIFVEDHDDLRREIIASLNSEGLDAHGVSSGAELFFELLNRPADIVMLDIELPGENGMEILQQLRSLKKMQGLGIIMLTGHSDLSHRLKCLNNGADVFLVKPVEIDELTAYIENLYRRLNLTNETTGRLQWRFSQREWRLLCPSGAAIELSHLESELITILVANAGKPVRRRDIIVTAFHQDPMSYDNRRLEAIVSRLRRKIHEQYPLSQPIKAVHSIGYIFTDAVIAI